PVLFQNSTLQQKETYEGTLDHLESLFGPRRQPGSEIEQNHKDIAAALQMALQSSLMHILRHFKKETGQTNLCMAGGVALNCSANGMIRRSRLFRNIFVQPAAGDDGSALGAALYLKYHRENPDLPQKMVLPLWGPRYRNEQIVAALRKRPEIQCHPYEEFEPLAREAARRLAAGEIIGWFRNAMEFGPRALGNRSILADPRQPDMRARVNRLIKKREDFRPFAPAVTAEAASKFFDIAPGEESTFSCMLFVTQVKRNHRQQLPAVTHVDGSARVQTVSAKDHPQFWTLLNEFGKLTGYPILLNTSFNVKGQPIVCNPDEAIETFLAANLDALVIENYIVLRNP
ncbi:MAG TPA: carbamoyltransferase C-terminal domain-containing protein, partial [Anaerolineales bacterium]|nr:carbamoyltransferase C-terminal domain-containing protein [Anaerolineales bacterium]